MKKLLVLLFAVSAMFLVSCKSVEYKDWKKAFANYEKAIDKARDCDDLEDAFEDMDDVMDALIDKYPHNTLSEKEDEEITELENRLKEKLQQKKKQLCD